MSGVLDEFEEGFAREEPVHLDAPGAPAGRYRGAKREAIPSEAAQRQAAMRAEHDAALLARMGAPVPTPLLRLADPADALRFAPLDEADETIEPNEEATRCAWPGCESGPGIQRADTPDDDRPFCGRHRGVRRTRRARGADPLAVREDIPEGPCAEPGCQGRVPACVKGVLPDPRDAAYCRAHRLARRHARHAAAQPPPAPNPPEKAPMRTAKPDAPKPAPVASGDDPTLSELLACRDAVRVLGGLAALERFGVARLAAVIAALGGAS